MGTVYSKTLDWPARSLNSVSHGTHSLFRQCGKKDTPNKIWTYQLFQAHTITPFAPIKLIPKLPLSQHIQTLVLYLQLSTAENDRSPSFKPLWPSSRCAHLFGYFVVVGLKSCLCLENVVKVLSYRAFLSTWWLACIQHIWYKADRFTDSVCGLHRLPRVTIHH